MAEAKDPLVQLTRALDQTGEIIARVRPEQASLPTPCREWDVRALVNHVVYDVQYFTAMVEGSPWDEGEIDRIGDDWVGRMARRSARCWQPGSVRVSSRGRCGCPAQLAGCGHGWRGQ